MNDMTDIRVIVHELDGKGSTCRAPDGGAGVLVIVVGLEVACWVAVVDGATVVKDGVGNSVKAGVVHPQISSHSSTSEHRSAAKYGTICSSSRQVVLPTRASGSATLPVPLHIGQCSGGGVVTDDEHPQ